VRARARAPGVGGRHSALISPPPPPLWRRSLERGGITQPVDEAPYILRGWVENCPQQAAVRGAFSEQLFFSLMVVASPKLEPQLLASRGIKALRVFTHDWKRGADGVEVTLDDAGSAPYFVLISIKTVRADPPKDHHSSQ
jgi:hypothetical protein